MTINNKIKNKKNYGMISIEKQQKYLHYDLVNL